MMTDLVWLVVGSPVLDQGDVYGTPCAPRAEVEGSRGPQQSDAVGSVVGVERGLLEEGLCILRKLKLLIVIRQRLLTLWVQVNYNENLRAS